MTESVCVWWKKVKTTVHTSDVLSCLAVSEGENMIAKGKDEKGWSQW
jgi:hypothetical protein